MPEIGNRSYDHEGRRRMIPLNGRWYVRLGPLKPLRSVRPDDLPAWSCVEVPRALPAALDLPADWRGTATYGLVFEAPEHVENEAVLLTLAGVYPEPRILLNGRRIRAGMGGMGTLLARLDPFLREGGNLLLIQFTESASAHYPRPSPPVPVGLWGPVWLEIRPQLFLQSARVTAEADGAWSGDLTFSEQLGEDTPVQLALFDPHGRAVSNLELKAPGRREVEFAGPKLSEVFTWSPEYPTLYRLEIKVGRERIDRRTFPIGFRTFEITPCGFLLNGKRVHLRAVTDDSAFAGWGRTPPSLWKLRRRLEVVKELGFNALVLEGAPPDLRLPRLADRLGLLLWYEIAPLAKITEKSLQNVQKLLDTIDWRDGNCPSLVAVNLFAGGRGEGLRKARSWVSKQVGLKRRFAVLPGPHEAFEGIGPVEFVPPEGTEPVEDCPRCRILWAAQAPCSPQRESVLQGLVDLSSLKEQIETLQGERLVAVLNESRWRLRTHGYVVKRLFDTEAERCGLLRSDGTQKKFTGSLKQQDDWVGVERRPLVLRPDAEEELPVGVDIFSGRYESAARVRCEGPGISAVIEISPRDTWSRAGVLSVKPRRSARYGRLELSVSLESSTGHLVAESRYFAGVVPAVSHRSPVVYVDRSCGRGDEFARFLRGSGLRFGGAPGRCDIGIWFGLRPGQWEELNACRAAVVFLEEPKDLPAGGWLTLEEFEGVGRSLFWLRAESAAFAPFGGRWIGGPEFDVIAPQVTLAGLPQRFRSDVLAAYLCAEGDPVRPVVVAFRLKLGAGLLVTLPLRRLCEEGNALAEFFLFQLLGSLRPGGIKRPRFVPPLSAEEVLVPTSREGGAVWRYAFSAPRTRWYRADFDDRAWPSARGGFGRRGTRTLIVRRTWETRDIYLRCTFSVERIPKRLALLIFHDRDAEVVLNGRTVLRRKGYSTDYVRVELEEDPAELLSPGTNVLAVHCRHERASNAIDVGLLAVY